VLSSGLQHRVVPREEVKPPPSAGFLLALLFDYENGVDIVSENFGLPPNHTALQTKRLYSP
jgi:hypothetical protein